MNNLWGSLFRALFVTLAAIIFVLGVTWFFSLVLMFMMDIIHAISYYGKEVMKL